MIKSNKKLLAESFNTSQSIFTILRKNGFEANTKFKSWKANQLNLTENIIYLGHTLLLAIEGFKVGLLVTNDNYILDGNHRYVATMLSKPKANFFGTEINNSINSIIPLASHPSKPFFEYLEEDTCALDMNICNATIDDILNAIFYGKYIDPKFYNKDKAISWLEKIGGKQVLEKRLKNLQSNKLLSDEFFTLVNSNLALRPE